MKYAWIEAHLDSCPVRPMCELLGASPSGFYAARSRAPSAHAVEQAQIVTEIRRAQTRHRGLSGRRRMMTEVRAALNRPVNEKRIGRLMRLHDLSSRPRRRFRVVTTDSKHLHPVAANVLGRDFEATAPNQKWLADLTCVPTDEGWLYLALVLDLFSRKLVGWAMSEPMPQELTLAALRVALGWRDPPPGLVHPSDRGSQYAAGDDRKVLQARGMTVSMSRKGDCWENQRSAVSRAERREGEARHNAPMESVNGTVKVECVHGEHFRTRAETRQALVEYIGYYNTERRHSSLGNLSPAAFERRWQGAALPTSAGGGPLQ